MDFFSKSIMGIGMVAALGLGMGMKSRDAIGSAERAANAANIHQLEIALEMYNLDHGEYPEVSDGSGLVGLLYSQGYILSRPNDPNILIYEIKKDGTYTLKIRKNIQ